jgi:hypothetical protein
MYLNRGRTEKIKNRAADTTLTMSSDLTFHHLLHSSDSGFGVFFVQSLRFNLSIAIQVVRLWISVVQFWIWISVVRIWIGFVLFNLWR